MSKNQVLLEKWKKRILDSLYHEKRRSWHPQPIHIEATISGHFIDKNIKTFPKEGNSIKAAFHEVKPYMDSRQHGTFYLSARGILKYEREYNPPYRITYDSLCNEVLRVLFNKADGIEFSIAYFNQETGMNVGEKDLYNAMAINHELGFIAGIETNLGISFGDLTDSGSSEAIRLEPIDPINDAVYSLSGKLEYLDYIPKDKEDRFLLIQDWVDQLDTREEKNAALFLLENLDVFPNEKCIVEVRQQISDIPVQNGESVFFVAAGGSGTSGEKWRHKVVRGLPKGKERSLSLESMGERTDEQGNDINWSNRILIFIDDTIGTGYQFTEFFQEHVAKHDHLNDVKMYYAVILALDVGKEKIENNIPKLNSKIRTSHDYKKFFDASNEVWATVDGAYRSKLLEYCKEWGKKYNLENIFGYKDSQLLVAFQDHTPNNTLGIFWEKQDKWKGILGR